MRVNEDVICKWRTVGLARPGVQEDNLAERC